MVPDFSLCRFDVQGQVHLGLISGGLDSAIAVKLMLEQGIEVVALYFATPFDSSQIDHPSLGRVWPSEALAAELGVEILIERPYEEYLELIKHPPHGYGRAINPTRVPNTTAFLKKALKKSTL